MFKPKVNLSPKQYAVVCGLAGVFLTRTLIRFKNKMQLAGKVVLITGGSRGVGLSLAKKVAQENATVIICARSAEELNEVKKRLKREGKVIHSFVCDVTDQKQVSQMVQMVHDCFGKIDLLINNAGVIQVGHFSSMNEEDFQEALAIDFWGAVQTTFEVLPEMIQRRQGRIANISSIGGVVPIPHLLPYSSAKFAVRGFSEGLSTEASEYGVKVITINPGLMRTGSFLNAKVKAQHAKEYRWFSIAATLPLFSMSTERAAKKMLRAIKLGKATVTLGFPAQFLSLSYALFLKTTLKALSWMNRVLPGPNQKSGFLSKLGKQIETPVSEVAQKMMGEEKLEEYNQVKKAAGQS